MRIICTICSKIKDKASSLLPAHLRYISPRIITTKKIADKENVPFYLLSGKYGLIKCDEIIPYYEHLLIEEEVDLLSQKVINQIKELGITEIDLYAKPKETENWKPYHEVIESSTSKTGIPLKVFIL